MQETLPPATLPSVLVDLGGLADAVDGELRTRATPGRAEHERAYLQSSLEHYGTTVPAIRAVAKDVARRHLSMPGTDVLALAEALWSAPVHERRMAAVELLRLQSDRLGPDEAPRLERLLRESRTWALVDPLATGVIAPLTERHPALHRVLDGWVVDGDFWLRRAALLALLPALRRGGGDFHRFSRYADALLDDREFFVRKAIGWVLRDTDGSGPSSSTTGCFPERHGRRGSRPVRRSSRCPSSSGRRSSPHADGQVYGRARIRGRHTSATRPE